MKDGHDRETCGGYLGDVVPLSLPDEHGVATAVRHLPGGVHEVVKIQKVRDGEPMPPGAELGLPMGDGSFGSERFLAGGSGPAQVATEAYRSGWESVFGGKTVVGQA